MRDDYGFDITSTLPQSSSKGGSSPPTLSKKSTSQRNLLKGTSFREPESPNAASAKQVKLAKWTKMLERLMAFDTKELASITCRWRHGDDESINEQPQNQDINSSTTDGSSTPDAAAQQQSPTTSTTTPHHSLRLQRVKASLGLASNLDTMGVKFTLKIRSGVPPSLREQVWWLCSGACEKRRKAGLDSSGERTYDQILKDLEEAGVDPNGVSKVPAGNEVEKDLRRTFPNNKHFNSDLGLKSLRTLLLAYSLRNPEVGYCQSMNFIAAFLLLNMEEERAFWTMASIVEDVLPDDYYTKNMVGSRTDQRVLLSCLKWKLPALHKHFVEIGVAPVDGNEVPLLEPLTCTWYLCIFINSLSLGGALRVWDCFLHEGRKVLLRVGLAVLKICQPELLKCEDLCEVYEVIRNNRCIPGAGTERTDLLSADELIKTCYDKSWIGGFPHNKIEALREGHKAYVMEEARIIDEMRIEREEKLKIEATRREPAEELKEEEKLSEDIGEISITSEVSTDAADLDAVASRNSEEEEELIFRNRRSSLVTIVSGAMLSKLFL
jgi:hypothetical protein